MKKKEKRNLLILIIVVIIIIAILVSVRNKKDRETTNEVQNPIVNEGGKTSDENKPEGEFVQSLEDGIRINTSEELKKDKEIDGVQITNIQLTEEGGLTVLLANVTNSTDQEKDVIGINVIVLDKDGNEIGTIPAAVSPLKAGETKQLYAAITGDYANAYNFRVEKQ